MTKKPILGALALATMLGLMGNARAQSKEPPPSGGPPGKGRVSEKGAPQTNPKPQDSGGRPAMAPDKPVPPVPVGGKTLKMGDLTPPSPVTAKQGPASKDPAKPLPQGSGDQSGRRPEGVSGSHLHLIVRVTEAGAAEVVSATEIPGDAPESPEARGNYVFEVHAGGATVATDAIVDPFEQRAFAGGAYAGHSVSRAASALVPLKVPKTNLGSPNVKDLGFRLFRLKPGVQLTQIDAAALKTLKAEQKLETKVDAPAARFGAEIVKKGKRL